MKVLIDDDDTQIIPALIDCILVHIWIAEFFLAVAHLDGWR